MTNENPVRDRSIIPVYPRRELFTDETEKIVGAALRRDALDFFVSLRWRRKVTVAVCIGNRDDKPGASDPLRPARSAFTT